jgi:HlyD family secretion protein
VEKHRLLAAFSGVLQQSTPYPGEWVEAGAVVAILLDNTRLTVATELVPAEVAALREGTLSLRAVKSTAQTLHLREATPAANGDTGMVSLEFHWMDFDVLPGQSTRLGLYRRNGEQLVGR